MRRQAAFLLAAVVLLAAASPTRSYKKALREDTRELVLYQGFQTALIMRATLHQRILPYLYGKLTYQFEDYETDGTLGYDEHLYMLTVTHPF